MTQTIKEHWFIFQADKLLLMTNNDQAFLTPAILSDLKKSFIRQHHLGLFNEIDCYCAEIESTTQIPNGVELVGLRQVFNILDISWYAAAVKAHSIINWDKNHQFCGRCGNKTTHKSGIFERLCPSCGLALYPRISPSMIVRIQKDDHILMARSPHFAPGVYGLVAGFVEAGENVEEAVHREVKEEVGIRIKNLRYFGSQAWPFPDSLMIAFTADYDSGELVLDQHEIEDANWYTYDTIPGRPSHSISIAHKLIDDFVIEQTKKALP